MTQITIQSFKMNPSGKSGVIKSADGNDYLYLAAQHHHLADGMTFDVAVTTSEWEGKHRTWIDKKWPPFNGGQRPQNHPPVGGDDRYQPASPPPRPAPAPTPIGHNGRINKDVQITAIALMKSFIETGKFGLLELPDLELACLAAAKSLVSKC